MSRLRALARRLRDDERGAYVVELALVLPLMVVVMFVVFDFGYRMYLGSVVEGTLHRAARRGTIGAQTTAQIDAYINDQLKAFSKRATVRIEKQNYYQFSGVGKPEKITSDTAPIGTYNIGDCFEDLNGNGSYDSSLGRTGLGGSDDIVYYKVIVDFPRIVPLYKFLGFAATETVTANTILRNQPYASQTIPTIKCPTS